MLNDGHGDGVDAPAVSIGVTLPVDEPVRAAVTAEQLGFDFVATGEHVAFHGPTANAFVWLAAAAGATERIGLVSSVTLLSQYPAVLAAKLIASLDHVSNGRFSLGVGVGGEYPEEFRAVGVDPRTRGRRTDEALVVLRSLLDGQPHSFSGAYTAYDDIRVAPPARQSPVPVWISGRSEAAMRRAGRFGDVWLPYMYTPDRLAASLEQVHQHAVESGRRADAVTGAIFIWTAVDDDPAVARQIAVENVGRIYAQDFTGLERYLLFGTPGDCASRLREFVDAGARAVIMSPAAGLDDRSWDQLAEVRAHVS